MASLRFWFLLACPLFGCFAPTTVEDSSDDSGTSGDDDSASESITTTATASASATSASTTATASDTNSDATMSSTDPTDASDATATTDGTDDTTSADTGVDDFPRPICGDGELGGEEECDDGNLVNTDECKNDCTFAECGDGVVGPDEACDDGNRSDEDLCTTLCTDAACGDGFVQGGEQCDDANLVDHDGCTASCVDEPFCETLDFEGFVCPSGATQFCDIAQIDCSDQDDAVAACETCAGEGATCQAFQDVEGCNEGSGAVDEAGACPGLLNFVYQGDVCNDGIVVDQCQGGQIGTWCTP